MIVGEVEQRLWNLILRLDREPFCDGTAVAKELRDLVDDARESEVAYESDVESLDAWLLHVVLALDDLKSKTDDVRDRLVEAQDGLRREHDSPPDARRQILRQLIEQLNARQRRKGRDGVFTEDDFDLEELPLRPRTTDETRPPPRPRTPDLPDDDDIPF